MRIAIPAQGDLLASPVDPRFGRSRWFIIIDPEDGSHEACTNPGLSAGGGAGIQTAQFLSRLEVGAVLATNVGPNAIEALRAADVAVYTGISGTVAEALDQYRQGKLTLAAQPTVHAKAGAGQDPNSGT